MVVCRGVKNKLTVAFHLVDFARPAVVSSLPAYPGISSCAVHFAASVPWACPVGTSAVAALVAYVAVARDC